MLPCPEQGLGKVPLSACDIHHTSEGSQGTLGYNHGVQDKCPQYLKCWWEPLGTHAS